MKDSFRIQVPVVFYKVAENFNIKLTCTRESIEDMSIFNIKDVQDTLIVGIKYNVLEFFKKEGSFDSDIIFHIIWGLFDELPEEINLTYIYSNWKGIEQEWIK